MLPKNNKATKTYQEARNESHELLKRNVIEAASNVLTTEGPAALTVRRIAQELGCSTKIIYSMFGSRDGLANELYLEGCHYLRQAIEQIGFTTTPTEYLTKVGWAYWDFAQHYSSHYKLMFSGALADFKPDETSLQGTFTALDLVLTTVSNYLQQGLLTPSEPILVVRMFWAALHGILNLHFGHQLDDVEEARQLYAHMLETLVPTFLSNKAS